MKRLPKLNPRISSSVLQENFESTIQKLLGAVYIQRDKFSGTERLELAPDLLPELSRFVLNNQDSQLYPIQKGKQQLIDEQIKDMNEDVDHGQHIQILIPITSSKMDQEIRTSQKLQSKLKDSTYDRTRSKFRFDLISAVQIIQKNVRRLLPIQQTYLKKLKTNNPIKKVWISYRKFENQMNRILTLYDSFNNRIHFSIKSTRIHRLEGTKDHEYLEGQIGIDLILQKIYGEGEWHQINKSNVNFYNKTLQFVCSTIDQKIEMLDKIEDGVLRHIMIIHLDDTPIFINLKVLVKHLRPQINSEGLKPNILYSEALLKAAISLQKNFRQINCRDIIEKVIAKKQQEEIRNSRFGKLMKITFKKIDETYYKIWVFEKESTVEKQIIINLNAIESSSLIEKKTTLSYRIGDNILLNTQGLDLIDYLIHIIKRRKVQDNRPSNFYLDLPDKPKYSKVEEVSKLIGEEIQYMQQNPDYPNENDFQSEVDLFYSRRENQYSETS